ncbi:MAG: sugar ABC transporter permease [Anaerolineae bacterium]|nr:sugar ABC transporter permease [Anaerolineae bacterium]
MTASTEVKPVATGAGAFRRWLYRMSQKYVHWFFIAPALIAVLVVAIYPIVYSTGLSFFRVTFDSRERPFVLFENFAWVLSDPDYRVVFGNTLLYVFVTVSGAFVLGFGAALLLRRITAGRNWLRLILLLPLTIAPIVVGLTWNWMLDPLFGLINWILTGLGLPPQTWLASTSTARIAVMLVDIWQWYPLIFLIMDAGLSGLPRAPYESARLEGASEWTIFRRITLPLLRPVILVALLLRTVDAFRTFDLVRVMTDGGPAYTTETLSLYLYRTAFNFNKLSRAGAGSMIMLLVIGIISALMFRYLYRDVERR